MCEWKMRSVGWRNGGVAAQRLNGECLSRPDGARIPLNGRASTTYANASDVTDAFGQLMRVYSLFHGHGS